MLVNANCPYAHRDTVSSPSPCTERKEGKLGSMHYDTGPGPSGFQQSYRAQKGFLFPQRRVVWIPSSLCLRREVIKINLEQKSVESLSPLHSVQGISPN